MKTTRVLLLIMLVGVMLVGCNATDKPLPYKSEPLQNLSVSIDEIKDYIKKINNFNVSADIRIDLPKGTETYYDLELAYSDEGDFKRFYDESVPFIKYVLGEDKFDENALYFIGTDSEYQIEDFEDGYTIVGPPEKVSDHYETLVNNPEYCYAIEYNTEFLVDESSDSYEYFSFIKPIGISYLRFNKGETADLLGRYADTGKRRNLGSWLPILTESVVGAYLPDSDAEFALADGKTSIKSAVEVCENFLKSLPYPKNPVFTPKVANVNVFPINDDFGFMLNVTKAYNDIPFDYYTPSRTTDFLQYSPTVWEVYMCNSTDVDVMYSLPNGQIVTNSTEQKDVVTLKSALEIISKKLSQTVQFDVKKIELLYCETAHPDSGSEYKDMKQLAKLAWKVTLYNVNDDRTYVTYIDAKDGENFRYYIVIPEPTEEE
ncbi:hypothetical protein FACS1894217_02260 [Clostridia bacterium]|nr:hypothetical protein FACS1894217_02260 [Clostridia bacterium]